MTAPGSSGPDMTSPSTTQVTTPGSSVPDMTSPNTTQFESTKPTNIVSAVRMPQCENMTQRRGDSVHKTPQFGSKKRPRIVLGVTMQ
ncbi:hypothetical protein MTO96_010440 [Rhipicephalus appendiculatus]